MDTELFPGKILDAWESAPEGQREALRRQLSEGVRQLLTRDFEKLLYVLYRVDVSEKKLKQLLQLYPDADAAVLITDLLIERQLEKIRSRQAFPRNDDIPGDERW